eukprot:83316-Pelagomonas_calceolata.AAC.3
MNEFGDVVNRLVITRQGSPTRPLDLARVSASRASTVIWMPPDQEEEEKMVRAVMLDHMLLCVCFCMWREGKTRGGTAWVVPGGHCLRS